MSARSHSSANASRLALLALASAAVLACGAVLTPLRTWSNLLIVGYYLLTLSLGGALFVALSYASGATWSVGFRRVPEAMARLVAPYGVVLFCILFWQRERYSWHHHGTTDPGTFWFKELWMKPDFWLLRSACYIVLWILLSYALVAVSRRQDQDQALRWTLLNRRLSAVFLVVFAVTFSLASCDWLMLLEPMWFSTMWGVYNFAGMAQATIAAIVVFSLTLKSQGSLGSAFTDEHLHDLGKLLLGFSCFWMYIWFSQYMLIWYTNIPEETSFFMTRTQGPWGPIQVLSILLNWLIPFFALLPRPHKRNPYFMMRIAAVILLGRWIDLYLIVFPATLGPEAPASIWEVAGVLLLISSFGGMFLRSFQRAATLPVGDPLLQASLHYHC
jgi:hypothetical protein